MFGTVTLGSMRTEANRYLPDTAVIRSVSYGNDGAGGVAPTSTPVGTVSCRIDPLLRRDVLQQVVANIKVKVDYVLSLPYGTPLQAHWEVVVGSNTYEIVGLANVQDWGVYVRAYISQMQ